MTTHTEPQAVDYRTHLAEGSAFVRRVKNEDWAAYTAAQFITAIQQAISYDAVRLARRLADAGAERFPDEQRLQRYARVLAPPVVRRVNTPEPKMRRESMEWIKFHAHEHRGQWIAVKYGVLVGAAESLQKLLTSFPEIRGSIDTVVTRVQ